jgi:NAD(P) transhydrogenase subunit alpha
MQIGIPAETRAGEARVAATPETVKKLAAGGLHRLVVQSGAGMRAAVPDADFQAAGATIVGSAAEAFAADIVLKVRGPEAAELGLVQRGGMVVGLLDPWNAAGLEALAQTGTAGFALEWLPRTSRAQAMDVLSSQANIAGYKAIIIAANEYGRFMPQLMTAAGTVKAARIVILGAGVAGLQAIATAKRLGAVIEASDVRPAVKEQIESLGAKFIDVPFETDEEREIAKGVGGYARPMPKSWLDRQQAEVAKRIAAADIVVATAQIPGRKAPVLVTDAMVQSMKPGSVLVDLAVETGGNVEGVEFGRVVQKHGAKIVGLPNLAGLLPADASALYARNLLNFINLLVDPKSGELKLNRDDDIIAGALACIDGAVVKKG